MPLVSRLGLVALLAAVFSSHVHAQQPRSEEIQLGAVRAYLAARAATMQAAARPADVDTVLAFCTPSVIYEHPRVGVRRVGVDAMREGMVSFLGSSRAASITITATLQGRDMVAAKTDVAFEAQDGASWQRVQRSQTWVFEFDGAKIKRIIEYW
jgi:hypothetical protein